MTGHGFLRRFCGTQSGSVTVEFVLLFPAALYILLMSCEVGLWNTRELMLRRATNLVIREVRLTTGAPPSYEEMKQAICERSIFTDGCMENLRVEMRALPISAWSNVTGPAQCIDHEEDVDPLDGFKPGQQNELMIVRVCRLFDPIMPGGGFGNKVAENSENEYGVRVTSAFVTEPLS